MNWVKPTARVGEIFPVSWILIYLKTDNLTMNKNISKHRSSFPFHVYLITLSQEIAHATLILTTR